MFFVILYLFVFLFFFVQTTGSPRAMRRIVSAKNKMIGGKGWYFKSFNFFFKLWIHNLLSPNSAFIQKYFCIFDNLNTWLKLIKNSFIYRGSKEDLIPDNLGRKGTTPNCKDLIFQLFYVVPFDVYHLK